MALGPTGGNLQSGNVLFTSDDGSVKWTGGPALGQVDARVATQKIILAPVVDLAVVNFTAAVGNEWPNFGAGTPLFMRIVNVWFQCTNVSGNFGATNPSVQIGTNITVNNVLGSTNLVASALTNAATQGPKNQIIGVASNPSNIFPGVPLDGTKPSIFVQTATAGGTTCQGKLHVLFTLATLL